MMRKGHAGLAIGLVLSLILTAAAFAASPSSSSVVGKPTQVGVGNSQHGKPTARPTPAMRGKKSVYRGTVAAADAGSLTLTMSDGSTMTFNITADTRVKIPTLGNSSTLADIQPGANAVVQTIAGSTDALRILVIPGKPMMIHRVGAVSAYATGASITIQDRNGDEFAFTLTADTKILPTERADQLSVGSRVTIISRRDVTGGPETAQGIVVHPAGTGSGTETND